MVGKGKTADFRNDLRLLRETVGDETTKRHVDHLIHFFGTAVYEDPMLDGKPHKSLVLDHLYGGEPELFLRFLLDANALMWVKESYYATCPESDRENQYLALHREFNDEKTTVEFTTIDEDEPALADLADAVGRAILSTWVLVREGHLLLPKGRWNVARLMTELGSAVSVVEVLRPALSVVEVAEPPKKVGRWSKVVEDDDDDDE